LKNKPYNRGILGLSYFLFFNQTAFPYVAFVNLWWFGSVPNQQGAAHPLWTPVVILVE